MSASKIALWVAIAVVVYIIGGMIVSTVSGLLGFVFGFAGYLIVGGVVGKVAYSLGRGAERKALTRG